MYRTVFVLLFALGAPAAAQAPDRPPEVVALRFGWAIGDRAMLTREPSGEQSALRVAKHEAGLEVVIEPVTAGQEPTGWIVSESGEFLAPRGPAPDTAAVRQEWEVVVGTWAGADVDLGDTYHLSSVEPMPLMVGATVPVLSEIRVTRAACDAAATDLACVRLHMIMRPDPVALRLVLEDAGERAWRSISWELQAEVIASPETLRPMHATITRRLEAVPIEGSPRTETERRVYAFDWAR